MYQQAHDPLGDQICWVVLVYTKRARIWHVFLPPISSSSLSIIAFRLFSILLYMKAVCEPTVYDSFPSLSLFSWRSLFCSTGVEFKTRDSKSCTLSSRLNVLYVLSFVLVLSFFRLSFHVHSLVLSSLLTRFPKHQLQSIKSFLHKKKCNLLTLTLLHCVWRIRIDIQVQGPLRE